MTVAGKRYVECSALGVESLADAEDSSYDSDYEAEKPIGPIDSHTHLGSRASSSSHPEVSRTTSDTLAAEFAEYVTLNMVQEQSPTHTPGYIARVEFALKLGYTERLVQTALQKLGPDPGQNELLAELIKLGASTSQLNNDADESDFGAEGDTPNDKGGGIDNGCGEGSEVNCIGGLRPVVIDGSNVAMSHGNKEVFSCRGIKICVDWFRSRGHKEITVFVPKWRKEASRPDNPIADQEILSELEKDRLLVFTPSRLVGGRRMVCYDDRYILRLAAEVDGIVVSNDNYRDLAQESPEFRRVVEERILMYSFVNDRFMPPDDPLGRSGPSLENFLRVGQGKTDSTRLCPYAKKCTYGNKCKYRHPERGPHPQKSVTERLVEHAQRHLQARAPSLSLPLPGQSSQHQPIHKPLCKSRSATSTYTPGGKIQHILPAVSKRRSLEGMGDNKLEQLQGNPQNLQGHRPSTSQATRLGQPSELINLHSKLQRQLTLNPTNDPRLHSLVRQHTRVNSSSSSSPLDGSLCHQSTNVSLPNLQHKPQTSWGKAEKTFDGASQAQYPRNAGFSPLGGSQLTAGLSKTGSSALSCETMVKPNLSIVHNTAGPSFDKSLTPSEYNRRRELGFEIDPRMEWLLNPVLISLPDSFKQNFYELRLEMYTLLIKYFPENEVRIAMCMRPFEVEFEEIYIDLEKCRIRNMSGL